MLCSRLHQPSPVALGPFLDLHWPVRSLWPETRPLIFHMEQEMLRHLQEMRQNMEYMERLQQKIFQELDASFSSSNSSFQPISFQESVGKDGGFALSLDTQEFIPEELSVKQVGQRLRVNGRSEQKKENGQGSYSYRCQEFQQDFLLPAGIKPENITCSLVGGRLQIQAPREPAVKDGKERIVPINVVPAIASSTSTSGGTEENSDPPSEVEEPKEN